MGLAQRLTKAQIAKEKQWRNFPIFGAPHATPTPRMHRLLPPTAII
jgi:hypothetical protein